MYASDEEITLLKQLETVDRGVAKARKQFDELPHRQAILITRTKIADVKKKQAQVREMLNGAEVSLNALVSEDERLNAKQHAIEEKLQEVKGDYRSVEAQTKELNGVAKRQEKVSVELEEVSAQVSRVQAVLKQVDEALSQLQSKEKELIESFQAAGTKLQAAIHEGEKAHVQLAEKINRDLLREYDEAMRHGGGVALAVLDGTHCGTCRSAIDPGRLVKIRSEAPLSHCPSCKRLMIVES